MYSLNKQAIMDYDDETLQWKKEVINKILFQ